jgi:hypothetical protein
MATACPPAFASLAPTATRTLWRRYQVLLLLWRMDIVHEMSGWADPKRTVAIYRQAVPVERLLMTYLETEATNHPYREAEAVLLGDPTNQAF